MTESSYVLLAKKWHSISLPSKIDNQRGHSNIWRALVAYHKRFETIPSDDIIKILIERELNANS